MEKLSTKEKLFQAAIDLYSKKGYGNVSIRELGAVVGIKESSIYNHFSSKQAILDEITAYFIKVFDQQTPPAVVAADYIAGCDEDAFITLAKQSYQHYINDPLVRKIWKILSMEKFSNPDVNALLKKTLIDDAIAYQTEVFKILNERGILVAEDPEAIAIEFHAFNLFLYYRFVELETDTDDSSTKKAEELLVNHVRYFNQIIQQKF